VTARLICAFVAVALTSAVCVSTAWSQAVTFQADAAHTGHARGVDLRGSLRRAWTRKLPGRVSYPVVAGGRVFVVRRRPELQGSEVVALALSTGKVLWRFELGKDALSAALAFGGGRLIVTRQSWYDEGDPSAVLALAPADGSVLWQRDTGLFTAGPPVVAGDAVYLNGPESFSITALRLSDGAMLWHASTDSSGAGGSPAVAGDAVFVALSSCPDVHRFRSTDGAEVWHLENGCHGGGGSVPVLYRDRLYVTESQRWPPGDVYDAATGGIVAPMRADLPPVFAGRTGVFPDARRPLEPSALFGHTLVARDVVTGRKRWTFRGDGYLDSAPLIADGRVFAGSGSGRVYGIDVRRGKRTWQGSAGAPVPAPTNFMTTVGLAAAGDTLLVPALGRLVAFR
jgi:outer membrane protein assembly factor BamB